MSTLLFLFGLAAWIADHPDAACLLLALAWLFHGGMAD
jgi:hypothetical protein